MLNNFWRRKWLNHFVKLQMFPAIIWLESLVWGEGGIGLRYFTPSSKFQVWGQVGIQRRTQLLGVHPTHLLRFQQLPYNGALSFLWQSIFFETKVLVSDKQILPTMRLKNWRSGKNITSRKTSIFNHPEALILNWDLQIPAQRATLCLVCKYLYIPIFNVIWSILDRSNQIWHLRYLQTHRASSLDPFDQECTIVRGEKKIWIKSIQIFVEYFPACIELGKGKLNFRLRGMIKLNFLCNKPWKTSSKYEVHHWKLVAKKTYTEPALFWQFPRLGEKRKLLGVW